MSRLGDIQEVLWVSAPELVLFTLLVNSLSSACGWTPLALELLLYGVWKLHQVNWVRGEHSQEEWPLLLRLVLRVVCVWYYHVVARLLIVLWSQPASLGDFTIAESLKTLGSFHHDIAFVDLPKSVSLRFDSNNQEVYGNVWSLRNFLILLHQTENYVGLFSDRYSELGVVKPSIISIILDVFTDFTFFLWVDVNWVWTTSCVSVPFS